MYHLNVFFRVLKTVFWIYLFASGVQAQGVETKVITPLKMPGQEGQLSDEGKIFLDQLNKTLGVSEEVPKQISEKDSEKTSDQTAEKKSDKKAEEKTPAKLQKIKQETDLEQEQRPKKQHETGAEFVERRKREVREELARLRSQKLPENQQGSTYQKWREETQAQYQSWHQQVENTLAHWKKKQQEFLENLPVYKNQLLNLDDPELFGDFSPQTQAQTLQNPPQSKVPVNWQQTGKGKILEASFQIPIRNQWARATCSAFASLRAFEIILWTQGYQWNSSPQYFYWASRPTCQKSPCTQKGSWITSGVQWGLKQDLPDIPLEKDCPYVSSTIDKNETQTPLSPSCLSQGKVRAKQGTLLKNWNEVKVALDQQLPVVAAFKLSENFYLNKGLVTFADANLSVSKRNHASGHAMVVVGYRPLPEKWWAKEGRVCWIVANSWGQGWGLGGHACLTDKWVQWAHQAKALYRVDSLELKL